MGRCGNFLKVQVPRLEAWVLISDMCLHRHERGIVVIQKASAREASEIVLSFSPHRVQFGAI